MTQAYVVGANARESAVNVEMESRLREMEERLRLMQNMQEEKDELIRLLREQNEQLRSAPPESVALAVKPTPAADAPSLGTTASSPNTR